MTSIQPELWVDAPHEALAFYEAAFGATGRTLLVVEDPEAVVRRAVAAGATQSSPVQDEHDWRLGRIIDSFGHEWEIGAPLGTWPPP